MKEEKTFSRRNFVKQIAFAGSVATVLSACGGGETALNCSDTSGLSAAEVQARNAVKYVDKSPEANKNCLNCQLWQSGTETKTCGKCQLVKGPIHPEGYCISWVQKVS